MSRGIFDKLPLLNEPIPIVPWLLPMARETRAQTKKIATATTFSALDISSDLRIPILSLLPYCEKN
jgi:hypothetical protein